MGAGRADRLVCIYLSSESRDSTQGAHEPVFEGCGHKAGPVGQGMAGNDRRLDSKVEGTGEHVGCKGAGREEGEGLGKAPIQLGQLPAQNGSEGRK